MTRLDAKEKATLATAKIEIDTALEQTGRSGFVGRLVEAALASARRAHCKAAVARELRALDPRLLEDIGVQPDGIRAAAASTAAQIMPGVPSLGTLLLGGLSARVALWRRRRVAARELMSLDDRMLADIGLRRCDIPAIVAQMVQDERPAREETQLGRPLRLWNRSRLTAKTLNALDDRALDDIGLVRGDIDGVAEELAQRSLGLPANANVAWKVA